MANPYQYHAGSGPKREKARVGNLSAGFIVGLAIIFDLIQILVSFLHVIPFVGNAIAVVVAWFVAVVALLIFGLWFWWLGVNYFTGKRAGLKLLAVFGTFVIELVPLVDALPAITAGVVLVIIASRVEDFVGDEKAIKQLSEKGKLATGASLIKGRRVAEGSREAQGGTERLRAGAERFTRSMRDMNLDNRTAGQYGKRSETGVRRYEESANARSASLAMVRGKNLRKEQQEKSSQNTQEG